VLKIDLTELNRGFNDLVDTVWLACAIDGEGCISLSKSWQKTVNVTNTKYDFVEKAAILMNTNVEIKENTKGNRKTLYIAEIRDRTKIAQLLESILPFLLIKEQHAKLMIEYCELRERYIYHQPREYEIYEELRKLNKRGKTI
jgi:hypothetical protein